MGMIAHPVNEFTTGLVDLKTDENLLKTSGEVVKDNVGCCMTVHSRTRTSSIVDF